jgi:hypothetical protein
MLTIEKVQRTHLMLLIAVTGAAFALPGIDPWSIAVGGGVMAANAALMQGLFRRLLRPGRSGARLLALAFLTLKLGFLLALLGLLFERIRLDGMSFAGGVTVFLVAAVAEAVRSGGGSRGET